MELRVLRYIVAVADTGSMTAAAGRERVSQPSLSRQIRALERNLGIEIFRRSGKHLEVTTAGVRFVQDARDLVLHARSLESTIRRGRSAEDVSVVCSPQLFDTLIVPAALSRGFPVRSLVVRESSEISDFVNEGYADLGISPIRGYKGLRSVPVTSVPLSLQIHPDVDPFQEHEISIARIKEELDVALVSLIPTRETRKMFDRFCISSGVDIEVDYEVETAQVAQLLAASNRFACVVSDDQPRFGLHSHPLRSESGDAALPIFALWKPDHAMASELLSIASKLGPSRSPVGEADVTSPARSAFRSS